MKSKTSRRLCQGMTLIEVLVAFVILGMVMAVIMRINATALRNHDVSKGYLAALQVAESRLESAGLENDSPTLIQRGTEANNIRWEFSRRLYLEDLQLRGAIGSLGHEEAHLGAGPRPEGVGCRTQEARSGRSPANAGSSIRRRAYPSASKNAA